MAKGSTDQIIVADVGDEVQRGREDSAHEMTFFPGEKDLKRKESVEPVNMAEGHVDDDFAGASPERKVTRTGNIIHIAFIDSWREGNRNRLVLGLCSIWD